VNQARLAAEKIRDDSQREVAYFSRHWRAQHQCDLMHERDFALCAAGRLSQDDLWSFFLTVTRRGRLSRMARAKRMILEERRAQSRPNTQARTRRGAGTRVAAVKSMLPGTYIVHSGRDRHDRLIVRCTHGVIDGYYVHQHGALAQNLDQFSIQVPLITRMCARMHAN